MEPFDRSKDLLIFQRADVLYRNSELWIWERLSSHPSVSFTALIKTGRDLFASGEAKDSWKMPSQA